MTDPLTLLGAEALLETLGDTGAVVAAGLLVGGVYGVAAQRSRFCLRAAACEFAEGRLGPRMAVWFLCFSTALLWTQAAALLGWSPLGDSRWLANPGSLSGAVIGGLLFGVGMTLARGCPGRLLVLGAGGNLRAIFTGLVFAVVAQATLRGQLAPLREGIAGAWITPGPTPQIADMAGIAEAGVIALTVIAALFALAVSVRNHVPAGTLLFGCGVGFAVALGWMLTGWLSTASFEPVTVESLSFSGPSADMLTWIMDRGAGIDFDSGLVPGVVGGAFLAAWVTGGLKWEGWSGARAMHRYLAGAALMGFGAMTAGGCAIGAGVTGGSALALTAWVALACFFIGGAVAHRLIDARPAAALGAADQAA